MSEKKKKKHGVQVSAAWPAVEQNILGLPAGGEVKTLQKKKNLIVLCKLLFLSVRDDCALVAADGLCFFHQVENFHLFIQGFVLIQCLKPNTAVFI